MGRALGAPRVHELGRAASRSGCASSCCRSGTSGRRSTRPPTASSFSRPALRRSARARARRDLVTVSRFLGPDTDAYVASVERHAAEFEETDRHRSWSVTDRPERPLLLEPDPPPAGRRRRGRRVHVGPGAGPGAPRRRLRPAARRPPRGRERRLRSADFFESLLHCNRWSGRSAIRSARAAARDPGQLRVVQPRLRPGGARARRRRGAGDVGRVPRRRAHDRRAHRRRRRGFGQRGTGRLAHDVHGLRDPALVVRRRGLRGGRCALASPEAVRATGTFSRRSSRGPADWPGQRWYELALDFGQGRYGLIVDSDHYVAFFEEPARLAARRGDRLRAAARSARPASGARTSGRGRW